MDYIFQAILFYLLSVVIVLPIISFRWALFSYLLIVHVNLSGGNFESASTLGLENAIKIVLLPTVLLFRTKLFTYKLVKRQFLFKIWVFFVAYVFIATFWSPFQLSAVKFLGYLYSYTVCFLVFLYGFLSNSRSLYRQIVWSMILAIAMATFEAYVFGGQYHVWENRFSSYSSPQSFALYLALILALIFSSNKNVKGVPPKVILIPLVFIAMYLCGSRTGLVAILFLSGVVVVWYFIRPSLRSFYLFAIVSLSSLILLSSVLFFLALGIGTNVQKELEASRSYAIINVFAGKSGIEEISTFAFRLFMAETILKHVKGGTTKEFLFGRGTSSAGMIFASKEINYRNYNETTVDANRVVHNEFLRSVYEWGILGLILFTLLCVLIFVNSLKTYKQAPMYSSYLLVWSLFVVLLFLLLENILAGSSTPGGTGIVLVISALSAIKMNRNSMIQILKID